MKKPLLVVVDDWEALEVYEAHLEPYFDLTLAPFGSEGLRIAKETRPRRVLLDLTFEDMTPGEAIEAFRSDRLTAEIPLTVVFSRGAEPYAREAVYPRPGDHSVRRPYELAELLGFLNS